MLQTIELKLRPENGIFAVLMTFTFTFPRISYTLNALTDGVELFVGKNALNLSKN